MCPYGAHLRYFCAHLEPILCPFNANIICLLYTYPLPQRCVEWTLSDASRKTVDARASDIARNSGSHFPPGMEILAKHSLQKCVVWHRLSACAAWAHLFAGIFPDNLQGPLTRLIQLLQTLHDETSDVSDTEDPDNKEAREERTRRLTQFAVETLCRLETAPRAKIYPNDAHFNTPSLVHSTLEQRTEFLVLLHGKVHIDHDVIDTTYILHAHMMPT
jgi:hypothetical protein